MITKFAFADELAANMEQELTKGLIKQASGNPDKAIDYLNDAIEILDKLGLTIQADNIINILSKIADKLAVKMPSINQLIEAGLSKKDLQEFNSGNTMAKAKMNHVLRHLGYSEHQMAQFIGPHNVMKKEELDELMDPNRAFTKITDWLNNPTKVPANSDLEPGTEFNISSLAAKRRKKLKAAIDAHTKGLTPDKMVQNLLHHGTEFNMADDNKVNDLLNLEIGEDDLDISKLNLSADEPDDLSFEDEI